MRNAELSRARGMTPAAHQARGLNSALAMDLDSAFEDLVRTFQDGLYSFAVGISGDFARAEDIVQEAFLRAYRALSGYERDRTLSLALRPWLYRITLNVFRNSVRSRAARLTITPELPERADPAPGPEEIVTGQLELRDVLLRLGRLPEPQRAAVILRYVRDLSYVEIAEMLDQPVGTVKSNVHRALEALRRDSLLEVS